MTLFSYSAGDLFQWLTSKEDILVLDVRNDKDFNRFQVESPFPFDMINVSYYDFMEIENESVAKVPLDRKIRIVCAKEGSAKYVGEILSKHKAADVGYLSDGIRTWGNLLTPKLIHDNDDYQLYQFIRPGKASCSYGLIADAELMLFDPSRNIDFYLKFAAEKKCKIVKTFETHLQADYIAGSRILSERTQAEFHGNEMDFRLSKNKYSKLRDGQVHTFSSGKGPKIKTLFTPGHTPGSTSFTIDDRFMISGDTIFINSIGRPDLGGKAVEWAKLLFNTMEMVKKEAQGMTILPGHYIDWTEADESLVFSASFSDIIDRNKNIYDIDNEDDFISFIQNNMRPQPEEYGTIRLVNANLRKVDDEEQEALDLGKNECAASAYAKAKEEAENTSGDS